MMTDKIADMLTRIRNAQNAQLLETEVIFSGTNQAILETLKKLNFIKDYYVEAEGNIKRLFVQLKYISTGIGTAMGKIHKITRVSKPGRRFYCNTDFYKHLSHHERYIISTNKGIMSGSEAKDLNVGGEVICKVS